jgi:hypothetical protein
MNTQPTPETDAAYKNHAADMHDHIPLDFARKLELERDEARFDLDFRRRLGDLQNKTIDDLTKQRDEAREVLRQIRDNEVNPEDEADKFLRDHVPSELSKVREQLAAVTEQRDRLAEALMECLERLEHHTEFGALVQADMSAMHSSREALQSLTPKSL